ncbi:hypothetical protein DFQ28_003093, partial [Apophysomyces sp. BC1034]
MLDEAALNMVSIHLRGCMGTWWDAKESKIKTWKQFEEAFMVRYASAEMKDTWWAEISNKRQGADESMEDVAHYLEELYDLVKKTNEAHKIHHFLKVIHREIAYDIKQKQTPRTLEEVVDLARHLETVKAKYGKVTIDVGQVLEKMSVVSHSSMITPLESTSGVIGDQSVLSVMSELVKEMKSLKINMARPAIKCFVCGKEGHKKFQCPEFQHKAGKERGW